MLESVFSTPSALSQLPRAWLKDWICGQAEDRWIGLMGRNWGAGRGTSCHAPALEPSTAILGLCLEMSVGKGRDSGSHFLIPKLPKVGQPSLSLMRMSQGWMCSVLFPYQDYLMASKYIHTYQGM